MMDISDTWRRAKEMYTYRHEPEYVRPLAELFWRALLVLTATGVVGVLVFAATVFWDVLATLGNAAGAPARTSPALDRAALQNTLRLIEEKRLDFEARKATSTPVVDPSR